MFQFLVWGSVCVALAALGILLAFSIARTGRACCARPPIRRSRRGGRSTIAVTWESRRLIAAATLAASPHNSQPWRFSASANEILLHADFSRKLGAMDPFEREMFIGLGCALENIAIAAPGAGFAADITLLPDSKRGLAARVTLTPADTLPHRLERMIARRRTDRGPYDATRPVDAGAIRLLQGEFAGDSFDSLPFDLVLLARGSAQAEGFARTHHAGDAGHRPRFPHEPRQRALVPQRPDNDRRAPRRAHHADARLFAPGHNARCACCRRPPRKPRISHGCATRATFNSRPPCRSGCSSFRRNFSWTTRSRSRSGAPGSGCISRRPSSASPASRSTRSRSASAASVSLAASRKWRARSNSGFRSTARCRLSVSGWAIRRARRRMSPRRSIDAVMQTV